MLFVLRVIAIMVGIQVVTSVPTVVTVLVLPQGPRTQITGLQGPNTPVLMVFRSSSPITRALGPLGKSKSNNKSYSPCFAHHEGAGGDLGASVPKGKHKIACTLSFESLRNYSPP